MTSQSPRVYTYKITFEEVPYYYYGVHKEKVFNEEYWGSPKTNKWCWELYTPKKQILEFFEFSDKGYLQANLVEDRLIRPVLNNEWCLNESCGGVRSLKILREKSGVFLKKWVEENGNPGPEALKKYLKENPEHQSVSAKKCFEKNPNHFNETLGKYIKENPNHQKNAALKSAQSKWMDLDHPELGVHHFNKLIGLQRRYGFPSSRENRVRVS